MLKHNQGADEILHTRSRVDLMSVVFLQKLVFLVGIDTRLSRFPTDISDGETKLSCPDEIDRSCLGWLLVRGSLQHVLQID